MTVHLQLHQARVDRGLSLRALQERCNVDAAALSRYERGVKVPRIDTVEAVAAALGCEVDLRPARSAHDRFIDALCSLQADAVVEDPAVLDDARTALTRLEGRSASVGTWRALLDAGPAAVIGALTSTSPHTRALKSDSPLALVVEVSDSRRLELAEAARAT